MAKKYIDADKLQVEIARYYDEYKGKFKSTGDRYYLGLADGLDVAERVIDSLRQEQPDFPTTDEQMKEFLATHPKIEVPEKYKNPDWLLKKQEQPSAGYDEAYLNEKIAKASKTWEGVDVDKYMAEMRGYEQPSEDLEKERLYPKGLCETCFWRLQCGYAVDNPNEYVRTCEDDGGLSYTEDKNI